MKRPLLWGPAIGYMALLFFASSVPGDQLPGHFWDKLEHFLAYGALGALFLLPLAEAQIARVTPRAAVIAVGLATLYGAFDEIHQSFTPERTPDLHDLLADCLGATLGVVVILTLVAIWRRLRRRIV
jgi:VanZ family protein